MSHSIAIKPQYRCTQSALYWIGQQLIVQLHENLGDFSKFKSKYSAQYIDQLQSMLNHAKQLPDYHKRNQTNDSIYSELIAANAHCTLQWQILKRYIIGGLPNSEHAKHFALAGARYYNKACLKNWESSRQLLLAAQAYLNQYSEILKTHENMPAHFPNTFQLAYTQFSKHLFTFQQTEVKAKQMAKVKIESNNALFQALSEICNDGQLIYKNHLNRKTSYTFSKLLQQAVAKQSPIETSGHAASLRTFDNFNAQATP